MVTSKRFKPFIPLILSLLLGLVLFFLVKDFLRTVIIEPLLYVLWFFSLIAESLPQSAIWAGFILLMSIIVYASLKKEKPEKYQAFQPTFGNSGQVQKWARLLDSAQSDRFAQWRLANELKRLTRKLLSPSDDREKNRNQDDLELPAEITIYFEAPQPTQTSFWERLNKETNENTKTVLDLDPEIVIQYLEKRLRP